MMPKAHGVRCGQSLWNPAADVYRTRDGWIIAPTIGDQMFRRWARLVGREDLIDDPRLKDDITRGNNSDLINDVMTRWCAARTRDEAIQELERARIPCGPVYDLDEVLSDEQVRARQLLEAIDYPGSAKAIPVSSVPVRLSETPGDVRRRAPTLGEHTDEVLTELGFRADEITAFRNEGAI